MTLDVKRHLTFAYSRVSMSVVSRKRASQSYELSYRVQRAFGARLQQIRKRRGSLQKILADHLGLSRTSVSNIERGTHRVFLDQVYVAAYALGVDVSELLPPISNIFATPGIHTASDDPLPADAAARADRIAKTVQRELVNTAVQALRSRKGRKAL